MARCLVAALFACHAAPSAFAQTEDEEELWARLRPGLVANYDSTAAHAPAPSARRLDPQVAFAWGSRTADARLPGDRWHAAWAGRLFTIVRGEYRLAVHAAGRVKLTLAGQVLIDQQRDQLGWFDAQPITLSYGYHPLELEYQPTAGNAQISLYWQGPNFGLEPVAARYLYHDPPAEALDQFERGEQLAHALRCAACHRATGQATAASSAALAPARPLPAPALTNLAGNVRRDWLIAWLQAAPVPPADETTPPARRMPHFKLDDAAAAAVADYLLAEHDPHSQPRHGAGDKPSSPSKPKPPKGPQPEPPSLAQGRQLFRTLGCLACHQAESLGQAGLFGGGDLSQISLKRPATFFATWLENPAALNPDHRMPVFNLGPPERASLSLYLAQLGNPRNAEQPSATKPDAKTSAPKPTAERLALGKKLVEQHNCAACHRLPRGLPRAADSTPLAVAIGPASRWERSCSRPLAANNSSQAEHQHQPAYAISKSQAQAVQAYFAAVHLQPPAAVAESTEHWQGSLVLAERNCLACHARDAAPGLEPHLDSVLAASPELAPLLAGMKPPALHGVGDKLHRGSLEDAIALRRPPLRPWLSVRMPKFDLADGERTALVDELIAIDRIPPRPHNHAANSGEVAAHDSASEFSAAALLVAGSRLVTSSGFGCTSCHQVGNAIPQKVELKSQGPDLSRLSERLRKSWFDRWMPNPARIVPRMEMPSVVKPIAGVLDDNVNTQLAAVWHVLDLQEFNPPKPNPTRIVRRSNLPGSNLPGSNEPAAVLTDVLEVDDYLFLKPLIIGLPNRHNVLFDLEHNRLALWWLGDTARQHTRGKSWYWEPGGTQILPAPPTPEKPTAVTTATEENANVAASDLILVRGDQVKLPQLQGQFPTEFDWLEHTAAGLRFQHRLQFAGDDGEHSIRLTVTQTVEAWPAAPHASPSTTGSPSPQVSGVRRQVHVSGMPPGWQLALRAPRPSVSTAVAATLDASKKTVSGYSGGSFLKSQLDSSWSKAVGDKNQLQLVASALKSEEAGEAALDVVYATPLPVDRYTAEAVELPRPPVATLDVVPGYTAVRLPVDASVMPTALAWRPDGTLIVASLKGRVWLGRDTDGDGLEDSLKPFSDDLAAPYGVRAAGDAIDVINKYALLRLTDADGDGVAERAQTLVSGWGHTADYHDWAVGLPRDAAGNYYLAIPCQQDLRSAAAARYRGEALRLAPRMPTPDNPQSFAIEPIAAGLRFPMGLALDRHEQLFATDNQGHYNPFNELNHLLPGRRYGFINRLEFRPDFKPPLTPPAVNLPHPWTRSVNGLCFLYSPTKHDGDQTQPGFGPFEGHLLGCEYDSRQLIRMSLDRVGGELQGAAYPFTRVPAAGEAAGDSLEGPLACEVAPDGSLYIGNIRDSAWGGGANTGSLVKLTPGKDLPPGIAEVRAAPAGFEITFTAPIDRARAAQRDSYKISSYRRVSTPAYGGADVDRAEHAVRQVAVAADGLSAHLKLDRLRGGFVYELRLENLSPGGTIFHPDEAHYSMNRVPE